jgi:hypothetical protein
MFCANTSPVPDDATDFGEICPPIVFSRYNRRSSLGGPGGTRLTGDTAC